jgi:hypothetical protein
VKTVGALLRLPGAQLASALRAPGDPQLALLVKGVVNPLGSLLDSNPLDCYQSLQTLLSGRTLQLQDRRQ